MLTTKELPIQQAEGGEKYGDKVIWKSKDFQTELHKQGVTDLFDPKLIIKQDKEKYIFNINGENKFAVNTKVDFTNFIYDFYKDLAKTEQRAAEKKAIIDVSQLEKKTRVEITYTETAKDLDELANEIKKNEELEAKATSIENVKYKVERETMKLKDEEKIARKSASDSKYDKKDKQLRKIQEVELGRRLQRLEKIKKGIELLEKNKNKKYYFKREGEKIKEVDMEDVNAMDMKMTLKQMSEEIEKIGKETPDFILSRNETLLEKSDTTRYFEVIGYSPTDAKKLNKALKKVNKQYAILDDLKLTGAKRQEISQDLQDMEIYLNKVINEPNTFKPSEHPFIPTHIKEFCALMKINPTPEQDKRLSDHADEENPRGTGTGRKNNEGTNNSNNTGNTNTKSTKEYQEYAPSSYSSAREAFEKGGINGVSKYALDQTNMKPEQKQFRSGAANLAVTGGAIFLGWKMLSSAFKMVFKSDKEKKTGVYDGSNRARLGIPIALTMGSQAWTGEGLTSLFKGGTSTEKLANIFGPGTSSGGKEGGKERGSETAQEKETRMKYAEGFPGSTALFNGLKYKEMKQFLIKDEDRIKIDPTKYDAFVEMFKNGEKKNETAVAFLQNSVGKDDERHVIDLTLKAILGENARNELESKPEGDFNKKAAEAISRLGEIANLMETKKYNKMNAETQYLVDKYISGDKTYTLKELERRGDIFYQETILEDKTGLADKAKELANGDAKKERELLLALNTFRKTMPSGPKKIEIDGTRDAMTFKTYNQVTTINLTDKRLTKFDAARFSSYYEAFKVANLTNSIQDICKDKLAIKKDPFYNMSGMGIFYNDTEVLATGRDTRVVGNGALEDTSPIIKEHKEKYIAYLNGLRDRKVKPEEILDTLPSSLVASMTLIIGNRPEKDAILLGLQKFYTHMQNADRKIKVSGTRDAMKFETYGQSSTINLENKSLVGFTPSRFEKYDELFNAASLTNRIEDICKDKVSVKKDPFYSLAGVGIYFNNSDVISTTTDTEIVKTRSLRTLSPTLSKYEKEYIAYLNGLRNRKVKPPETEDFDTLPPRIESAITRITAGKPEQRNIIIGLKRFYTEREHDDRSELEVVGARPNIQFRTYGKIVTLNLQDVSIIGFSERFNEDKKDASKNYTELFKAANLTNYIQMVIGDKIPHKSYAGAPLQIGTTGGDIIFNDKSLRSFETDTKILNAGRFGSLGKTSKTLEKRKDIYVLYLNTLRDKTGLREKVRILVNGNDQRERDIIAGLNMFYDQMPNNVKAISLENMDWPLVDFKTYGETTKIDMGTKGITKFTACHFDDYLEVFKAANLTNAIKHTFKNRTAGNFPFNIGMFGRDVEFDRNATFEKGFPRLKGVRDVEAISAGRRGNLGAISPKLEDKKKEYVEYLNSLKFWHVDPQITDYFIEKNPRNP